MVHPETGARYGDFVLRREIGRGAMGSVWEAEQPSLGRTVAVKLLAGSTASDPRWIQRFQAEAGAVAKLSHPGILPVFGIGETDGQHWFAMELVEGEDLGQRLAGAGPLPPREAATVVRDAARALHHAHEHGVIHRDVKPANLMIRRDGRVAVTDFGLAKHVGSGALTTTGLLVGTPYYMSPELVDTKGGSEAGPPTDVYGLGATLYELLVGRPPFTAESPMALIKQIGEKDPPPPSQIDPKVPRDLETIALVCLEKKPERRYASADALADDLGRFLDHQPIAMRRPGIVERVRRTVARNRLAAAITAVAAALLLGAVAFFTNALHTQEEDYERRLRDLLQQADQLVVTGESQAAAELYSEAEEISKVNALPEEHIEKARAGSRLVRLLEQGVIERQLVEKPRDWREAPAGHVEIRAEPPDATVHASALTADGLDDAVSIPRGGGPVEPGLYRIELEAPGHVRTILNLVAVPGMDATLDVALPEADETTEGMTAFAGNWRPNRAKGARNKGFTVERSGGAFLLDEQPTTNAEYAAFVETLPPAARTPLVPRTWSNGEVPKNALDAPVRGLDRPQRQAYATWRGKRLATQEELGTAVAPRVVMELARAPQQVAVQRPRDADLALLMEAAARERAAGNRMHVFRFELEEGVKAPGADAAAVLGGLRLARDLPTATDR